MDSLGRDAGPGSRPAWPLLRPLDFVVGALLLLAAASALPYLFTPFGSNAEVTVDGRKSARLSLAGPERRLDLGTRLGPMRIVYGEGKVRIAEAPCPNGLCVKSGPVSRAGAGILCLPCRVRVSVSGGRNPGDTVDAVTY